MSVAGKVHVLLEIYGMKNWPQASYHELRSFGIHNQLACSSMWAAN
jgi:hypothetical protein